MDVTITERTRIKRASAMRRHGKIHVSLPRHWPKQLKNEATLELVEKVLQGEKRQQKILNSPEAQGPRITLTTQTELTDYVETINQQTFQVTLNQVRLGHSRYSRLAQMNIKNRVMTVSCYCLDSVPETALRYLIIHELAHCFEANHNQHFWRLVEQYVPDYRKQSRIMKAFHNQAVSQAEADDEPQPTLGKATHSKPDKSLQHGFFTQINLF